MTRCRGGLNWSSLGMRAPVTQILNLALLPVDVREELLFVEAVMGLIW